MDKIKEILDEKYGYTEMFRLKVRWAEKAENEGADSILLVDYMAKALFAKAA